MSDSLTDCELFEFEQVFTFHSTGDNTPMTRAVILPSSLSYLTLTSPMKLFHQTNATAMTRHASEPPRMYLQPNKHYQSTYPHPPPPKPAQITKYAHNHTSPKHLLNDWPTHVSPKAAIKTPFVVSSPLISAPQTLSCRSSVLRANALQSEAGIIRLQAKIWQNETEINVYCRTLP